MEFLATRGLNFTRFGATSQTRKEDALLQQMRQAGHLSIKDEVMFGSAKPRLPLASDSDESILAANAKMGEAHARRLAKTTPVVPLGDMKGHTIKIELRKVAIPDYPRGLSEAGIGLFVDGKPWMFQPDKKTPFKYLGDFFPPHDIQRHILVARDRTMHLPTIAGEYLTGMVSRERMLSGNWAPRLERMWDGLIANFADAALPKSSFSILEAMIGYLSGSKFPIGSSIRLEYHVPPADIVYRETGRTKVAHFMLNNEPVKETRAVEKKFHHPAEVFTRLSKLPGAKVETVEEDGKHQARLIKFPPVRGLTPVWEFKILKDNKPQSGESLGPMVKQYWLTSDGKKLDYEQAQRRMKGKMPDAQVGDVEYYQNEPEPKSGYFSIETVGQGKIETRRFNSNNTPELEPVYTGHPYRPVTLERVEVLGPDGKPADDLHFRMPGAIAEYKKAFKAYQDNIQELLEKGHIPMDSRMEVQVDTGKGYWHTERLTMLEHYRKEIQAGKLPKDMTMTTEGLYSALAQQDVDSFPISFPGEDLDIAPFPPPPYGGRHFKS